MNKIKKVDGEEKIEKWLQRASPIILTELGIGIMTITFKKEERTKENSNHVFGIKYNAPYKRTIIKYNQTVIDLIEKKEYKMVVEALIHEFCHIITNPLVVVANQRFLQEREYIDATEEVTEHVTVLVKGRILENHKELLVI